MKTKYDEEIQKFIQDMLSKDGEFCPDEVYHALADTVVSAISVTVADEPSNDVMFAFSMLAFNKILAEKVEKVLGIDGE